MKILLSRLLALLFHRLGRGHKNPPESLLKGNGFFRAKPGTHTATNAGFFLPYSIFIVLK